MIPEYMLFYILIFLNNPFEIDCVYCIVVPVLDRLDARVREGSPVDVDVARLLGGQLHFRTQVPRVGNSPGGGTRVCSPLMLCYAH